MNILLVDFGASRVKAVVYSLRKHTVEASTSISTPQMQFPDSKHVEVSKEQYREVFQNIFTWGREYNIQEIWMCSEMHGFSILESSMGYISWKDSRGPMKNIDPNKFLDLSGMFLTKGLPILNLRYLLQNQNLPSSFTFCMLPDMILSLFGNPQPKANATMCAGTGLFSIKTLDWDKELLDIAGGASNITFPEVVPWNVPLGKVNGIPVYGGIGDLQATICGVKNFTFEDVIINLGTGSQVIYKDSYMPPYPTEKRLGVGNEEYKTITHIPCGRAINTFANLFPTNIFWQEFTNLHPDNILQSKIKVGLGTFSSGGYIRNIKEGNFSFQKLLEGIALSWLVQYSRHVPNTITGKIWLAGGMSKKLPFVQPVLEVLTGKTVSIKETLTGEDTLDGLLYLAKEKHNDIQRRN